MTAAVIRLNYGEIGWFVDNFTDAGTEYWDDGSGDPTKLN